MTARTPDNLEYLNFSREVKNLAQRKYNFTFGNSSVSTFVTAFYDAVLLYALALKEILPEEPGEVNRLEGGNMTRRMWGKSFKGNFISHSLSLLTFIARESSCRSSERNFNLDFFNGSEEICIILFIIAAALIMYN